MPEPHATEKTARDQRVGQILNDFLDRRARGEVVSEAALLARHAELADKLREHLELLRDLRPAATRIESLVTQGILTRSNDPRYLAALGPYKVVDFIGGGGMGLVLKAYEESLDRTVALKILRPELTDDTVALTRFTREAKAVAALRHPNIVTVHAVGQEHGVHYMAMECVAGPSLATVIHEQGPPPTETVRHVFRQLLSGLGAAHDAGLIHRDIKPSNILLDLRSSEGAAIGEPRTEKAVASRDSTASPAAIAAPHSPFPTVKIGDFGLARALSAQTRVTLPGAVFGTPEYMSPEQARGDADIDHRTDLYSAGVVLYEMLTGRVPFRADTPSAVIHQILHANPPDPRKLDKRVDPSLASLAVRLLAKSPADRLASASKAIDALDARKKVRRRRSRRAVAVGLAVPALLVGIWALWQTGIGPFRDGQPQPPVSSQPQQLSRRISHIQSDGELPYRLLAWYPGEATPVVFYEFPKEVGHIVVCTLVEDADGSGSQAVIVGLSQMLDGEANLIALDANANELWRRHLCDESGRQWPDCHAHPRWICKFLVPADLDDEPGQELIAVAIDTAEYPSFITVIDPRSGAVYPRSTFWHMGHIEGVWVEPDYFAPGRPALFAWGVNNVLDGLDDNPASKVEKKAHWEFVHVVMVLDPADMDGLGPSPTNRLDIPAAHVHAYAYLDRAPNKDIPYRPDPGEDRPAERDPKRSEVARVLQVEAPSNLAQGADGSWKSLVILGYEGRPRGNLVLDRDLKAIDFHPVITETYARTIDDWKEFWRLIIQDGKYVKP